MTKQGGQTVRRPVSTTARRTQPSARVIASDEAGGVARTLSVCAKIVIVPLFSLSVIVALAYVRLLQGPVALPFLAEPIQRALQAEITGVEIKIEEVAVRLADSFKLEFELKNIRIAGDRDETLAVAPAATIQLSRPALLSGRLAPESIALVSPRLLLFHGEDGSLSLKFSHPTEGADPLPAPTRSAPRQASAPAQMPVDDGGLGRIDLVKVLTESSARARNREAATAYLREIGLKSATVVIDSAGRRSVWRLPELAIDLDHERSQSSIAGHAKLESLTGPWTVNFRTLETTANNSLQIALSVQGLVPRGLARSLPSLAVLEAFDVPVWGEARLDLSSNGQILGGKITVDAAPGQLQIPWLGTGPQRIDGAHLELTYDSRQKRFDVAPSVVVWGDSRLQFTGAVSHTPQTPEGPGWLFAFKSAGGWLAAEPPATQRLNIEDWTAQGFFNPERQRVALKQFRLRAGGADLSAEGEISDFSGPLRARLEGKLGPMSSTTFRALWPSGLAPQSRRWVQQHLLRGQLNGGTFRFFSGEGANAAGERASLTMEASNLAFDIIEGWSVLEAPRAFIRLDNQQFELAVPDGGIAAADGRRMSLKGNFTVDMRDAQPRGGHVTLRAQGPLSLVHELFDRPPFRAPGEASSPIDKMEGKTDAQVTLTIPFGEDMKLADIKAEGRARVIDGRMKVPFGNYDITSANITLDLAATSAEARGELLVNGVVGKISWQHVYGAPPDKQPPLRITSLLDNSYRSQLGLDINDLVQGDVGVDVTVARDEQGERQVHVRCDLVNAELILDSVSWRKPKGRAAVFEFDYAKGSGNLPVELHNVKLVGDNVALEGSIGIGADNKVREYRFPTFSLNVVSSLDVSGRLRNDGIWDVTARGATYDGRDLFRSFFDVGGAPDQTQKPRPGIDLKAEIGTVIGHSDTNMRNVRVSLQKRGHRVTNLDARGILEGGKLFGAVIKPEPNQPRRLIAEATDAGQLFKLVGFYPNAVGGVMNLEVFLDGQGAAERTGTLWARDFVILGDPIISEVLQNADGSSSTQSGKRKVVREQFEFEQMRIPFSVGHGQFVMHSGYIRGPLIGASMRGKVDFRAQQLNVGGTYVPLSGLNRALAPIPLLGPLLTGPRGEGVLGITFAIQGPMNNPQVLVNPLSLVTPGIFREIMQMTPEDPTVLPRTTPQPKSGAGPRASSSPAAAIPSPAGDNRAGGEIGGSWSTETNDRKR